MITPFKDISLASVRGVLLDLDDTLFSLGRIHDLAIEAAHKVCPMALSLEDFREAYRAARKEIIAHLSPQGSCRSRFFAFQRMAEKRGLPTPYLVAETLEKVYWDDLAAHITLDPEAEAFLKRCAAAEIPVCLVSNMTAALQVQKIRHLGVERFIRYLVTSEEAGAEKPDPRPFRLAMAKLGLEAQDVIMIGDSLESDIRAAEALGIQAYQIKLSGPSFVP